MRRAELAFLGFNAAEPALWVAILVYAFLHGGTAATGSVAVLLLLPAAVSAPFMAALGDRYRRERVLALGFAAQALWCAATFAAMVASAPSWVAYLFTCLTAVAMTTVRPTFNSLLPALAKTPEELTASNAVTSLAEGSGAILGTLGVTFILAISTPGAAFGATAAVLGVSTFLARGVRANKPPPPAEPGHLWDLARDAILVLGTIATQPGTRLLVGLAGVFTLAWGTLDVLLVTLAIDTLHLGESGVGALNTGLSVGILIGAFAAVFLVGRRRLAPTMLLGAILWGGAIALTGSSNAAALALVAIGVTGIGATLVDVAGRTLLQRTVTDDILTRVFGAIEALWMVGVGVGAALAPPLVAGVGLRGAFVVDGALLPVATIATWRALARVDARGQLPERQLALLRAIPMFAPLPYPVLERVAGQLDLLEVAAGELVIAQGDTGETFYVIDAGEFGVELDGRPVEILQEGDHFGEIALVNDVPRTASVVARTQGRLWVLRRDEFLAAITGAPQSHEAARRVAAERLEADERSGPRED
ncbi:MAG: MFS transporter [Actinomycetota bacterium]|nr:MFS transporter [Actinomycetota bacterium]